MPPRLRPAADSLGPIILFGAQSDCVPGGAPNRVSARGSLRVRTSIMKKLDIHDRAELALFAVRDGLVEQ